MEESYQPANDDFLRIRLPEKLRKQVEREAEAGGLTTSGFVRNALRKHIARSMERRGAQITRGDELFPVELTENDR